MFDSVQVQKGKPIAILMYIIPILFFLPLVAEDYKNEYGKFHANQALLLLIAGVVLQIVSAILAFTIIIPLLCWAAYIVLVVLGIIAANKGTNTPFPVIGAIKLIS